MPRPRNDSEASAMMTRATENVATTVIGGHTLTMRFSTGRHPSSAGADEATSAELHLVCDRSASVLTLLWLFHSTVALWSRRSRMSLSTVFPVLTEGKKDFCRQLLAPDPCSGTRARPLVSPQQRSTSPMFAPTGST